ncbi:hypothetical protein [Eubacterium sp. An11]|nr:hypothetical protein [Eubacterium sp. An11]
MDRKQNTIYGREAFGRTEGCTEKSVSLQDTEDLILPAEVGKVSFFDLLM